MSTERADNEEWRELKTASKRECPKLFYNFKTTGYSLSLYLTDLIAIWSCHMDRNEVVDEALTRHASIDPAESSAQFNVLLVKLRQSLEGEKNTLGLVTTDRSNALVLRTVNKLPAPLRPLEWEFVLRPQPAAEISEQILRPCLHEVSVSQQKIGTLQRIISEKDHVLSRLLERVENSATDLSLIFPGITGLKSRKNHITIADASKHVPGMAPFDQGQWESQFGGDDDEEFNKLGLNKLVTGCEKCFVHSREEHQNWIKRLPDSEKQGFPGGANRLGESVPPRKERPSQQVKQATSSDSDEFERQDTPPRGKKTTSKDDGDESDRSPSPPRVLGKIGALRKPDATKSRPSPIVATSIMKEEHKKKPLRSSDASTDTETASESGSDMESTRPLARPTDPQNRKSASAASEEEKARPWTPTPARRTPSSTASTPRHKLGSLKKEEHIATQSPSQSQPQSQSQATQTRRLGRIGLKRDDSSAPPQSQNSSNNASNTSTPSHRLGRVTPKRASTTPKKERESADPEFCSARSTSSASSRPTSPTPTRAKIDTKEVLIKSKSPPEPEASAETAEEKANRRRQELKRMMNENGGAKKKRRF